MASSGAFRSTKASWRWWRMPPLRYLELHSIEQRVILLISRSTLSFFLCFSTMLRWCSCLCTSLTSTTFSSPLSFSVTTSKPRTLQQATISTSPSSGARHVNNGSCNGAGIYHCADVTFFFRPSVFLARWFANWEDSSFAVNWMKPQMEKKMSFIELCYMR